MSEQILAFVQHYGPVALVITWLALVARTGFLLGGAVPGGSMIFAVGFVASVWSPGERSMVVILLSLGSFLGCAVGFAIARWGASHPKAPAWMRPDPQLLERGSGIYRKLGFGATVFAVSQPWACSISPFLAVRFGLTRGRYLLGSLLGSLIWVGIIFSLGLAAGLGLAAA